MEQEHRGRVGGAGVDVVHVQLAELAVGDGDVPGRVRVAGERGEAVVGRTEHGPWLARRTGVGSEAAC